LEKKRKKHEKRRARKKKDIGEQKRGKGGKLNSIGPKASRERKQQRERLAKVTAKKRKGKTKEKGEPRES